MIRSYRKSIATLIIFVLTLVTFATPAHAIRKFPGTTALQKAQVYGGSGLVTVGSGTGILVNTNGELRRQTYKVTVGFSNFIANAVTADVTLATLPAKTVVYGLIADVTQAFVCAATCTTATLSITCGKTAGGNEYLLSADIDAAAATFGDGIAEVGAAINATNLKDIPSMSATTTLQCRVTSGTGAVGTGTVTNFNAGSITYYLDYAVLP
jgi:hypothetical protein